MTGEFKQCPNGHYYQGVSCPYCKTVDTGPRGNASTELFVGGETNGQRPTERLDDPLGGTKTTLVDGQETVINSNGGHRSSTSSSSRTVFGDEPEVEVTPTGDRIEKRTYRFERRLVGWLVSYSFDPMGVDCRLYEGQNTIGRDMNNNITINDLMMSSKHATLLFRDGLYALKDEMSSHGTFVNDDNIGFEPRILKDGDMIRMGETIFKFRTSF